MKGAVGRRVGRPKGYADLEKYLVQRKEKGAQSAVFPQLTDMLAFAATYAAAHGQWEKLTESEEKIPEHIFAASHAGLFYFLALLREEDPEVLAEDAAEKRVSIFEGYANAGMKMIEARINLLNEPLDEIEELISKELTRLLGKAPGDDASADRVEDAISEEFGI
jgi:dnd system-associated protein 4